MAEQSQQKNQQAVKEILAVTWLGIIVNFLLSAIKILTGYSVSSLALIADGLHSLGDLITDFAIILGIRISKKGPDEEHPYGHSWAENFVTIFTAGPLAFAGCFMIYKAITDIIQHKTTKIGFAVLTVALIAIVLKEWLFRITRKSALKLSSSMLYANAWDHRSDALSSLAVATGAVSSLIGFSYADQIATIIVGLMIIWVSAKILGESIGQFTAKAVDEKTSEQIKKIIASQSQILNWHKLRTRIVGRELFMDLHILVEPTLTITEAHKICEKLEQELHHQIAQPVNIIIHIEPNE